MPLAMRISRRPHRNLRILLRPLFPALLLLASSISLIQAQVPAGASAGSRPELVLQASHPWKVFSAAFSSDGKLLVTGGSDSTIRLWDLSTHHGLRSFSGHKDQVNSVVFSPDNRWIASASGDDTIRIWDVASGRELRKLDGIGIGCDGDNCTTITAKAVAFSPDGRWLAGGSGNGIIRLWEAATGREVHILRGPEKENLEYLRFSPDGKLLASLVKGKLRLWEVESGREARVLDLAPPPVVDPSGYGVLASLVEGAEASGDTLAFSPDGMLLAGISRDGGVKVWETASGRQVGTIGEPLPASTKLYTYGSVHFASGGKELVMVRQVARGVLAAAQTFDLATGNKLRSTDLQGEVCARAVSPQNTLLFTSCWARDMALVDLQTGMWTRFPAFITASATALDSTGAWLATSEVGDYAVPMRVWDLGSGAESQRIVGHPKYVENLTLSPDGTVLASVDADAGVKLWDVASGKEKRSIPALHDTAQAAVALAFSPDGKLLASGADDKIVITDVASGTTLRSWPNVYIDHADQSLSALRLIARMMAPPHLLRFSPDGKWLLSSSLEGLKLYDAATGRPVATFQSKDSLLVDSKAAYFSPGGKSVVTASPDGTIFFWDPNSGRPQHDFKAQPSGPFVTIPPGAFPKLPRPMAEKVVTTTLVNIKLGMDRNLGRSWLMRGTFHGWDAAAFSPDGKFLAAADYDQVIHIYDLASSREARQFTGHTGQIQTLNFSADGRWLVSGSQDGTLRIWDMERGELAAVLGSLAAGSEWLVAAPDGLFDGSPGAWNQILWRFNNNTFDVAPVEAFFSEYYHPGLLGEILAGKHPRAKTDISQKDRRQPQVKLALGGGAGAGGSVATRQVRVTVEVQEAPPDGVHGSGSGARDLRLFRNGSLVKVWRGELPLGAGGKAALETEVTLVAGRNQLTAYAFNRDNIKSADAALEVTGAPSLQRQGTVYILAIGINQYANKDYNLQYAVPDARAFAEELARQQAKLGAFAKIEVVPLLDQDATKANILAALGRLAGETAPLPAVSGLEKLQPAQPEDAVLVYYAGHGTAAGPRFYLIPHDLGYTGGRNDLDDAGIKTILDHSVSDIEMEHALEKVDAGRLLLVIDACNSGQALESDEKRRGPMNSQGLAQLAYEKGMNVLTAAQGYQAALEAAQLGHGYLTYALVEEGLKSPAADRAPQDGQVVVREWLDYATLRVPQMQEQAMQEARKLGRSVAFAEGGEKDAGLQRPRVFYRREPEIQPFVVTRP